MVGLLGAAFIYFSAWAGSETTGSDETPTMILAAGLALASVVIGGAILLRR